MSGPFRCDALAERFGWLNRSNWLDELDSLAAVEWPRASYLAPAAPWLLPLPVPPATSMEPAEPLETFL